MTKEIDTKIMFKIKDMFGVNDYGGINYSKLLPVLIKDQTIVFESGCTNLRVRYHNKNGYTGSQLLFLFTRQYEHDMAEDYDVVNSLQDIVDEKDMEGKWKAFPNDDVRYSYCDRQFDGFIYNTVTKTIMVCESS
jgi:hypothetical protein